MKRSLILMLMMGGTLMGLAQSDGDKMNSAYKKSKIKNRARLQSKRGVDSIGDKQYIYADDAAVNEALELQGGSDEFSIGSVSLESGTRLREVNILVEGRGKKEIHVDQTGTEPAVVNVGHVNVEKGASVKKVRSIIEMEVQVDN